MGTTRTPRGKWIEEGLRALVAGGPEAVRIEVLAQALGVTKGGFYGHFRNRGALLTEMLDTWEYEVTESLIEQVEDGGGDARTKLARLFDTISTDGGPARGAAADVALRDWARRDPEVAERLRRVDNRHMDYLRSLFSSFCPDEDEVELRCFIAISVRIGNHFNAADHVGRSRAEVMELVRRRLLE
ncbi:TetR/AcrR family transcriptional regulator [Streptomyces sp. NPDC048111]|uniref:TetR/AcrR family transcriptional regulator n=1 Tax=Streptomyces sp. NPDC048111 TaxID=3365500 RepID=UPI00371CE9DD